MPLAWQNVPETHPNQHHRTLRARVPGGWLVEVWIVDPQSGNNWGGGLTFVPDHDQAESVLGADKPEGKMPHVTGQPEES